MKPSAFCSFILLILSGLLTAYFHFKHHFSGLDYYKYQVTQLNDQVEKEKLNAALVQYQMKDLQQKVAEVLPNENWPAAHTEKGFAYRNLASIVSLPNADKFKLERASSLFEQAKRDFRESRFKSANLALENLIDRYPESSYVVKAHFLWVEGAFQLDQFEKVVGLTEKMITHYPENDLTGFALLRLAKVYEFEERVEDAIDIYRLVLKGFKDQRLRQQARKQMEVVL